VLPRRNNHREARASCLNDSYHTARSWRIASIPAQRRGIAAGASAGFPTIQRHTAPYVFTPGPQDEFVLAISRFYPVASGAYPVKYSICVELIRYMKGHDATKNVLAPAWHDHCLAIA
jgi:hypothetical protein